MKPTEFELKLLAGVARAIDEWNAEQKSDYPDGFTPRQLFDWQAGKDLASANIVKVDLEDFLGRKPMPYETVLASRGWHRLESMGLIERIEYAYSSKISQVELLPDGRALVVETNPENLDAEPKSA